MKNIIVNYAITLLGLINAIIVLNALAIEWNGKEKEGKERKEKDGKEKEGKERKEKEGKEGKERKEKKGN